MFKEKKLKKALDCIERDDYKGLEDILAKGFDPFYKGKDGKSIYGTFIFDQKIQSLVDSYAAVYDLPIEIRSAYDAVVESDHEKLSLHNSDPNSMDRTGRSLLQLAFEKCNFKAVEYFLEKTGHIEKEQDVLRAAFAKGDKTILIKLLKHIDLKKILDEELTDLLHYQTIYNNNVDGLEILLDHIDIKKDGPELFNESIRNANIDMVKCYISKGADMNGMFDNKTPLISIASKPCYLEEDMENALIIAKSLVENGADPGIVNPLGKRAEDYAFSGMNMGLGYYLRSFNFDPVEHTRMLKENQIPESVFNFFEESENIDEVKCGDSYEMRYARFCNLSELRSGSAFISSWEYANNHDVEDPNFRDDEYGSYLIEVVEFIAEQNSHGANGILIWIPALKQFGCCDTDHGVVKVFKDVSFNEIVQNPCRFLNAQWTSTGEDIYDVCNPWEIFEYREQ